MKPKNLRFEHRESHSLLGQHQPSSQMSAASPPKQASKPIPPSAKPTSIWTRKLDLLYIVYFLIHIPVMFRKPLLSSLSSLLHPTPIPTHQLALTRNSNRPHPAVPHRPETRLPHHAPNLVHHHLRRPLLHPPAGLVPALHVHGSALPRPAELLGCDGVAEGCVFYFFIFRRCLPLWCRFSFYASSEEVCFPYGFLVIICRFSSLHSTKGYQEGIQSSS